MILKFKPINFGLPIVFFTFILYIICIADMNKENILFNLSEMIPLGDKVSHFVLYGILAFLLNRSLKFKKLTIGSGNIYLGSLIVFVFTVVEECSQLAFESRTFDLFDLVCNYLGVTFFSHITLRRYARRIMFRIRSFKKSRHSLRQP